MPDPSVTIARLEAFRTWLRENGRSEGTAELYVNNVRCCAAGRTMTSRLTGEGLAPKSLHTNKAALRAWAEYTDDAELAKRLAKIKLPPAERTTPKSEIPKIDWKRLAGVLRDAVANPPKGRSITGPVRAVIRIMSRRGLRCGDVLRLRRVEIVRALDTGTMSYEGKGRRRHEWATAPIKAELEVLVEIDRKWDRVEDLITRSKRTGIGKRRAAAKVVARALSRFAKEAGVEGVHPHRLRRTYATFFLRQLEGDPQALVKLQKHMGWANMNTALQYVDAVDRTELDRVGAQMVDALDED